MNGKCIIREDNKRIAKNSLMLYIRMIIIMLVTLFTSRVYLQSLGETDFGIFNIVGGIVVMFSFVSNTMQLATQRYLNYSMGNGKERDVREVFNVSMILYIAVSVAVLFFAETLGLWFLNTQMNIPPGKIVVANWVYQFSIVGFVFQTLRIPYNAVIIANERMSVYAYFSIVEALLKLGSALAVLFFVTNKLLLVSCLTMAAYLVMTVIYKLYCNKKFNITHFKFLWNRTVAKDLVSFSGWSLFGALANLSGTQGVNIILNIFWGVTVNAALGIANQLAAAVNQLVGNFQTAFNPQLVKLYASGDFLAFNKLIFNSSKMSFFLILYPFVPIYLCADFILEIWLGAVPEYTVGFVRLIMCFSMVDAISAPLWMSVQAVGKIRNYQILMSALIFLNLPVIYILMRFGYSPLYAWLVRVVLNVVTYVVRIYYIKRLFTFPAMQYFRKVFVPSLIMLFLAFVLPWYIENSLGKGWVGLMSVTAISLMFTTLLIVTIGLNKVERDMLKSVLIKKFYG